MADENHPLVELMLNRMGSHPEEFTSTAENGASLFVSRWAQALVAIQGHAPPEQAKLVKDMHNRILLDHAHKLAMDELLNGDERRKRTTLGDSPHRSLTALQAQQNAKFSQLNALRQAQVTGIYDPYSYQNAISHTTALNSPSLQIGNETIDEGMLRKIKGALGL